jgi:filamentous hemagglutinin family protein
MKTASQILGCFSLAVWQASANPNGLTVHSGTATTQNNGPVLTVTTSPMTVLTWNTFNINTGETTRFAQPSANSIVFNLIGDNQPSQILGTLSANGSVILANSHGFYFGPNSMIKVGGDFLATTAPLAPDFGIGSSWQFTGMPPLASIVNYGQISTGQGRSLFLIAENIANHGELDAPAGKVGLYSGKEVLVSDRADGRGLSATVKLPAGSIDNTGQIVADAGTIALQAQVVNQDGLIQANSVRNQNGVIELVASDQLNLGGDSQIQAHGDDSFSASVGGAVTLKSGNTFSDSTGSQIVTTGGARGGNGGNVEVSAPNILSLASSMDAGAASGFTAGRLLLDPTAITLGTSGSGSAGNGTVGPGGSGTLQLNVNTAFANLNFSHITLEATGTITLATGTTWNLSQSTGVNTGVLTLEAGGNIVFGNNSQITDANHWTVTLEAGVNFTTGAVQSGAGSIYLSGGSTAKLNGSVQTYGGDINMTAGQDILVGTGGIRTTGGGNINLQSLAGDINAGTANGGYQFSIFGYTVGASPGGIATAAGGNVNLQAGNNIISTPTVPSGQPAGASGAYGSQPGNVTLFAGNQVLGNFTVANGAGTLLAGVQVQNGQVTQVLDAGANVGSATRPVSLSLVKGSWNVWAANNIYLAEVRNPNGTFNGNNLTVPSGEFIGNTDNPTVPTRSQFLFDYAPNAAANLWAGNAITLTGANLPRVNGENQNMPPVYPPVLNLAAGAGGITVNNPIILYPSSQGALGITTTGGGSLNGAFLQGTLVGITMSDSSLPAYSTFAQGHAVIPLHLNDPNPVGVTVSGGINSFNLTVPTFADISVTGSTYNFGFLGQNLSRNQTTTITVGGDINYRGDFTTETLPAPLPSALFNPSLSGDAELAAKLLYNPATGVLTFVGQMSPTELSFLLNPNKLILDATGQPVLDANGQPETKPLPITAAQQAVLQQLYTDSQTATLGDEGLAIAGPGRFNLIAQNVNLGISGGISVLPPNPALAAISPYGASLNLNVAHNVDLTSSKIANEGLDGNLQLTVGGTLDVGGQFTTFGDPNAPKGIFTTSAGNVSVLANGNVNLDGSRIAAYNGGNIDIRSTTGDVNAGNGGVGFVSMQGVELNPATGQLTYIPATIAGSGILATTIPGSHGALGNITVETPEGSINASAGGIIQIALNGANSRNSFIDLTAGHDINATGSGIIGANLQLTAGGKITGILVGTGTVNVDSQSSVNVTALGGIGVNISAVGTVSGTVISGGTVSVSGESITASLIAQTVSTSGDATQAAVGVPVSNVAKDDSKASDDASTALAKADGPSEADDDKKKKAQSITLAQKTGRVTVVLPPKTRSSPSP